MRSAVAFGVMVLLGLQWPMTAPADALRPSAATAAAPAFQRLPVAQVLYRDNDPSTEGAAEPQWKPDNPRHLRMARDAARGPSGSVRDALRYAYLLSLKGDSTLALDELGKARQRFGDNGNLAWSEGWIALNLGDFHAALRAWQRAETLHGGRPYWVPYSKALALTGLGDMDAALAWWMVAQRSQAPHLDNPRLARRHFSYWRPFERDLLARLLAQTAVVGPVGRH